MLDEKKIIEYMTTRKYIKDVYTCWEFVQEVCKKEYDLDLPDYPVGQVQAEFKDKIKSNFNHIKINKEEAKEGDIIIFSVFANQHAGIMLNSESFIHMGVNNVVVSQIENIRGFYEIYRYVR